MKLFFIHFILLSTFVLSAQTPTIEWQKTFGGSFEDYASKILQTTDGGYVIVGNTLSTNGDITLQHGNGDFWVVKINALGNLQWQKTFGGTQSDSAFSIQQTPDAGYLIAGATISNNGDVVSNHGNTDGWLIKLNSAGNLDWQKTFGGTNNDNFNCISPTIDGGYILVGQTASDDGDLTSNHGNYDGWIVKIDALGAIQWQKNYGGSVSDIFFAVHQSADGGYIISGETGSDDGDITGHHGSYDAWVIKTNSIGNIQWQKVLGGSDYDSLRSVIETSDNQFVASGYSMSNNGDLSNNHGTNDSWIIKFSSSGGIIWNKLIGGSDDDVSNSIYQTPDNGYIVGNYTVSNDGDVTQNTGTTDCWLVKLNDAGNIVWQKSMGGSNQDLIYDALPTSDNGFIIAASSLSSDGDVTINNGDPDFWIVKLTTENLGLPEHTINSTVKVYPVPFKNQLYLETKEANSLVQIYDTNGKLCLELKNVDTNQAINTETLPKGNYVVTVTASNGKQSYKVIK